MRNWARRLALGLGLGLEKRVLLDAHPDIVVLKHKVRVLVVSQMMLLVTLLKALLFID